MVCLIAAGLINDFIENFEEEINKLLEINRDLFVTEITINNNSKLIDHVNCKFDITYDIIINSKEEIVTTYVPDFSQEKLDEIVRKKIEQKD